MSNKKKFDMPADYVEVNVRVKDFYEKYPDGRIQSEYEFFKDEKGVPFMVIATARAYRTGDDSIPSMGTAQEQIPGKTPYTRGSEIQNAETAAVGRAIVFCGASDAKDGIASREEIRNQQEATKAYHRMIASANTKAELETIYNDLKDAGIAAEFNQAIKQRLVEVNE